jgi:hypothetical protein
LRGEVLNFREFKKNYLDIARAKSINNDVLNSFMFLVLAGAACHKKKLLVSRYGTKDLRIHPMLIQASRSGKGEALKVLSKAAKICGLRMTDETQFTDAGIVGEVNSAVVANNRKKGYVPGDPEYQNPITIGDLGIYDIISFSEGKQMIKLSAYSEDKLEILQMAMDTPGWIRKKLAAEVPVEFEVNCSIIGTTYFLDDFESIFLEQGIFQRMLVNVREFGVGDREDLNKALCMDEPDIRGEDLENILQGYCSDLLSQINKVPNGTVLVFNDKAKEALWRKNKKWMERVKSDFVGQELEIMLSYTTSCINMYTKVAAIAAVLSGRSEITVADVNDAHTYISSYMNSIMNEILMSVESYDKVDVHSYIGRTIQEPATQKNAMGVIQYYDMDTIIEKVQEKYIHMSKGKIHKIIKDGLKTGFYEEVRDGNDVRIRKK